VNLKSPSTIAAAWLLLPLFAVVASWGLGVGVRLLSGMRLGALLVPTGYLTGTALITALLLIGVSGKATVALALLLAAAGPTWLLLRQRRIGVGKTWGTGWRALVWPAATAVVAYGVALAPLAGGGRLGVLGYVLNNDPSIHLSLIERLHDVGAHALNTTSDSFQRTTGLFSSGYPLGSYAWVLVARTVGGILGFYLWTPFTALAMCMLALIVFDILRSLDAPSPLAAVGGVLIANGHLLYAYMAQGGLKEVVMPVAVYGAMALTARAAASRLTIRSLIPAGLAAAAALADLGYAAAAWLAPPALLAFGVVVWRAVRGRSMRELRTIGIFVAVVAVVALPAIYKSISFYNGSRTLIENPREVGNLLAPVSVFQALNVWIAQDYRPPHPELVSLSTVGMVIAGVLAAIGLAYALWRRNLAIALAAIAGVAGVAIVTPRTSIYFDAKTYVILAPAVGLATAAGVVAFWRARGAARVLGVAAGVAVAAGVIASDVAVYEGVWVTPKERFEQLAQVADRFKGVGSMLVSDREQYAVYFLRRSHPWDDWGYLQLIDYSHVAYPGSVTPLLPHAPDFDDYPLHHIEQYDYLLERVGPDKSLPPANYTKVYEHGFFRVYKRTGPGPKRHLAIGTDGHTGGAVLRCRAGAPVSGPARRLLAQAAAERSPVVASLAGVQPLVVDTPDRWFHATTVPIFSPQGQYPFRNGIDSLVTHVPTGDYTAWLQGTYGSGVRLTAATAGASKVLGEVHGDLGFSDGWFDMGPIRAGGRSVFTLIGLGPPIWHAGSRHFNIGGEVVLVPQGSQPRIVRVPAASAGAQLCGRRVDWLELY
jgi:hypothetical protein